MQSPSDASQRPLAGIRVVDLADEKGELAGRLLADLGAEVVRVEPPGGARSRWLPPFHGGTSLYFAHRNSNKRGVVLDLERERDRAALGDRVTQQRLAELDPRDVFARLWARDHAAAPGAPVLAAFDRLLSEARGDVEDLA